MRQEVAWPARKTLTRNSDLAELERAVLRLSMRLIVEIVDKLSRTGISGHQDYASAIEWTRSQVCLDQDHASSSHCSLPRSNVVGAGAHEIGRLARSPPLAAGGADPDQAHA